MRALVVGATGALGRIIVDRMTSEGWRVWVHGFSNSAVMEEVLSVEGVVGSTTCDVRSETQMRLMCEAAAGSDGVLHAVIYAAGINPTAAPVADTDLTAWRDTIDVNLTGAFLAARESMPYLRRAKPGRLVVVSSIFGYEASPNRGAYSASKHGLAGLVQAIAREEAPLVLANGVAPGPMWTESARRIFTQHARERGVSVEDYIKTRVAAIPGGRFLEPEECAQSVVFLASERCQFVSGEIIRVTAGSAV